MQTYIQKWGNSLGIRIPSPYVKDLDLRSGSSVDISENDGKIIIIPSRDSLDDLLEKVNDDNIHEGIESGISVGKEEW